jgi:catechol 2,3-dioxygenase-like lactoylglutathione lyase family enzyme
MSISNVITQLRTTDLDATIDFYVSKLGLTLDFKFEDFYAGIKAGDQVFHLKLVDDKDPSIEFVSAGDHFHLYLTTEDVETLAKQCEKMGVVFLKEITETPWGTKEFSVADDQGHVSVIGQMQD